MLLPVSFHTKKCVLERKSKLQKVSSNVHNKGLFDKKVYTRLNDKIDTLPFYVEQWISSLLIFVVVVKLIFPQMNIRSGS